jgi:formylglycine-generating enzyme required for sulfatase activity
MISKYGLALLVCFSLLSPCLAQEVPDGMVLIPAGAFEMGTDEEDLPDLIELGRGVPHIKMHARNWFSMEYPRHTVEVEAFYMDAHEVTNREFLEFIKESGYQPEGEWARYTGAGRLDYPIVNITWNDANEYARWAGKRLPTEAEWEYAARGGKDVRWFPWGDMPDDGTRSNYYHKGETFFSALPYVLGMKKEKINTKPVGSYEPNSFGLYDVIGNVSEWVDDYYAYYPGGTGEGVRPVKSYIPKEERKNRKDKYDWVSGRVAKGGDWRATNPVYVRLTRRIGDAPHWYDWTRGFRCAKSIVGALD